MNKIGLTMSIYKDKADEYEKRHDEIWPELVDVLKAAGVEDYSIFLESETGKLFAVLKCESTDKVDELALNAVVQKWWAYMADIMDTNEDNSPVAKPLKQVFHLN
ncbi:L-rhamnose mutarotase [Catenovulum maritimum]|uniref:L-rhamnose mutarotase n=1 Tax=Catenovulum maritimum TaxID=1513271 RepID=A0A0J8GVS7_9ALTE|nr:L-rhamnose mutarotase [Catenovulum maritimum]KMT66890.1 L-rhamnose mutarotase [Catenovulum maritimum]